MTILFYAYVTFITLCVLALITLEAISITHSFKNRKLDKELQDAFKKNAEASDALIKFIKENF